VNLEISKNFYNILKIPNDWNKTRLKYVLSISENKSFNFDDEKILSLTKRGIIVRDISTNQGQIAESYEKYTLVKKGQICMNPMDLLSGWVDISSFDGIISPAYYTFILNDGFNNKFINYFLQSNYLRKTFFKLGKGVASHDNFGRWVLTPEELKNIVIFFPNIEKQKLISLYLDKKINQVNLLIEKIQKKIEYLKEQRISLINRCVTKGLNTNVEMKDSLVEQIGDIPKHWKVIRGKYILQILSARVTGNEIEKNGIPFIKVEDLNKIDDGYYLTESKLMLEPSDFIKPLPHNILIIPKRGMSIFTNKIVISKIKGILDSNLMGLKVIDEINTKFVFHVIKSRGLGDICDQSSVPQINNKHIYPLKFQIPPKEEQNRIVEFIDQKNQNYEKTIFKEIKRIETLREYLVSLISSTVMGVVKVTEDMI
jgi:type I restriction enzyme, S subunit